MGTTGSESGPGAGARRRRHAGAPATITRDDLWEALRRRAVTLVEALGPDYYADAHLPGAVNIPPHRVDTLAGSLLPDKAAMVVVYCSTSCTQSHETGRLLRAAGYTGVRIYEGGKEDWIEAGLPVERG